jgi:hypothetical protein
MKAHTEHKTSSQTSNRIICSGSDGKRSCYLGSVFCLMSAPKFISVTLRLKLNSKDQAIQGPGGISRVNSLSAINLSCSNYNCGHTACNSGRTAYTFGRTACNTGRTAYTSGRTAYNTGRTAYTTGHAAYTSGRTAYNTGRTANTTGHAAYSTGQVHILGYHLINIARNRLIIRRIEISDRPIATLYHIFPKLYLLTKNRKSHE